MNFKRILIILLSLVLVLAGADGRLVWQQQQLKNQIAGLTRNLQKLSDEVQKVIADQQKSDTAVKEVQNRQIVKQKSQDELLTAAVAKVAPAVVSIVISKDVPKLEVVYQNPFGNDPFFKDFNIQVPVYQQKGTTHEKVGAGTGFLITGDGYILTNKHVVFDDAAQYTVLLANGTQKPAKVVYRDPNNDVAIVRIDGSGYATVGLGDSSSLKLGQTVVAIGNALGEYNNSVSVGIISGLNRTIQASGEGTNETLSGIIQTDAAINPGNSGGPLLDLNGLVVGINVATVIGSNNISFSIPISTVRGVIKSAIGR